MKNIICNEDNCVIISAYNYKYMTTKKGCSSFFKFIYIDEHGYLNKTCLQYKTIQNTKYRIC